MSPTPWPLYNPALLPAERTTLATSLRRPLVERLLAMLERIGPSGAPQHQLVLGLPGAGKTMLLRALQSEVQRRPELAARWLPLTFAEAQWDVARPADFWGNALDYLIVALGRSTDPGHAELAHTLELEVAGLPLDEDARNGAALALLNQTSDRLGRRFLLLVDTLDVVLDRLKRDQWHVRDVLASEPRLLVIGTSARAIEATYRYDAAFYDFFQVHELRPLPRARLIEILAPLHPDDPLTRTHALAVAAPALLSAALDLLGTQPRMLALLGLCVRDPIASQGPELVLAALDLLTPALVARMDALSPQGQLVVHALAAHWHPARPSELAQRTRLSPNLISAQLHRLVQEGLVERVPLPGVRHGFLLGDRIFQAWLLMRMGQPHRRRLYQAIEHLVSAHRGALTAPPGELVGRYDPADPDSARKVAPELQALLPAADRLVASRNS